MEMRKKYAVKGKQTAAAKEVVTEGSKRATELDRRRRGDVVFFPSNLDGEVLQARYGYLWGREVLKVHGAPKVLAEGKEDPPDSDRFFCAYFLCVLCPPFLDFFDAMACMAIFAHLCERFVGVAPTVDLFRHFFVSRVDNKAHRFGNVSWIPRVARESWDYLLGQQRGKWEE